MLLGYFFFCSFRPWPTQSRYKRETKIKMYTDNTRMQSTHICCKTYAFSATTSSIAPGKSSSLYRDAQSSVLLTRLIDPSWWKSQTDSLNRASVVVLFPFLHKDDDVIWHFSRTSTSLRSSSGARERHEAGSTRYDCLQRASTSILHKRIRITGKWTLR